MKTNSARIAALLRGGARGTEQVPGLDWDVADAARHLVSSTRWFEDYVAGRIQPPVPVAGIPEFNEERIASIETRRPQDLASHLESAVASYLEATAELSPAQPAPWYGGHTIDLATTDGIIAGELVVHGYDIAQAVASEWAIDPEDAIVALQGGMGVLPTMVEPARAAGFTASLEIRMRNGPSWRLEFDDGQMQVTDSDGAPADCYVSADPVWYLLLTFDRIPQWKPIVMGKLVSWGRRPFLASKLPALLVSV